MSHESICVGPTLNKLILLLSLDCRWSCFSIYFFVRLKKNFFVPSGRLSWLPVSFLLHVKYTISYRIVSLVGWLADWLLDRLIRFIYLLFQSIRVEGGLYRGIYVQTRSRPVPVSRQVHPGLWLLWWRERLRRLEWWGPGILPFVSHLSNSRVAVMIGFRQQWVVCTSPPVETVSKQAWCSRPIGTYVRSFFHLFV